MRVAFDVDLFVQSLKENTVDVLRVPQQIVTNTFDESGTERHRFLPKWNNGDEILLPEDLV